MVDQEGKDENCGTGMVQTTRHLGKSGRCNVRHQGCSCILNVNESRYTHGEALSRISDPGFECAAPAQRRKEHPVAVANVQGSRRPLGRCEKTSGRSASGILRDPSGALPRHCTRRTWDGRRTICAL